MARFSGKRVDAVLLDHWRAQALDEQERWHETQGSFKSPRDREVFRAAFDHGWRQSLSTLRVQGLLPTGVR